MRKLSYLLILAGILLMLYPKASEWYNDWQQEKLLEEAMAAYSDTSPEASASADLRESYAQVSTLLSEESASADDTTSEPEQSELTVGGDVIGIISIDKINLKLPVLEGATKANMKHAAAHMEETAAIGQTGNAAIAAHRARTTGRLFNRLNEVEVGDTIKVQTSGETYEYEVYSISIVEPTDLSVLEGNKDDKILTLITCDPLVNPTHRLIVHAKLHS